MHRGEREFDFTIKAAVLEPYMGAVVIGTKICYISDDDLEMLQAYCKNIKSDLLHSSENREKLVYIHKDNACTLSDAEFIRQVNLDTGIVDAGIYSATKMISKRIHRTCCEDCINVSFRIYRDTVCNCAYRYRA